MTTDEIIASAPDEVVKTQRSLSTLLNLKTYQGMSDLEIQSIIDFWKERAYEDAEGKARQQAAIVSMNETAERWGKAADEANSVLKQLLAKSPTFVTIADDGITEDSK